MYTFFVEIDKKRVFLEQIAHFYIKIGQSAVVLFRKWGCPIDRQDEILVHADFQPDAGCHVRSIHGLAVKVEIEIGRASCRERV